jgi:D-alanyl-D-alanine carboxypeptidase
MSLALPSQTLSSSSPDVLPGERRLSRRTVLGGLVALGAAAVAGRSIGSASAAAQVNTARATSDLNLRAGPGTNYSVLRIIPNGGQVRINGRIQNGFQDVTYDGTSGWAHNDFLKPLGAGTPPPGPAGWGHTTTAVNFRSGPGTNHKVLRVLGAGAPVQLLGQQQNGFVYASHEGLSGWVHGDYVVVDGDPAPQQPEGTLRTLSDLNLRAEASLQSKVLAIMPENSIVSPVGGYSNNFLKINYKGTIGWAWLAYLG